MTMDTLETIRTRRSIRKYLDKPVPQDVLHQVLVAAMYAPSACNQQPWQFLGKIRLEAATGEDFSDVVNIPKSDGMMEAGILHVSKHLEKWNRYGAMPDGGRNPGALSIHGPLDKSTASRANV
jgi:nitroreductase